MLKFVRSNSIINRLVRRVIVKLRNGIQSIEKRWRIAGVIELQIDSTKFLMYSECDDGILEPIFYDSGYVELFDIKVFTSLVQKGSVIFDIGANTGVYSILSSLKGNDSKVYAFEPNPVNLTRLRKNIGLNSLNNVVVCPLAVGETEETVSFTVLADDRISDTSSVLEEFSRSTYRGEKSWKRLEVKQISIDKYVANQSIDRLDLMKIDVEGYEISVLKGALKTIKKYKPTILLESFLNEDKQKYLEEFVVEEGYFVYLILADGIVAVGQSFTQKKGLNFLLSPQKATVSFIPFSEIPTEFFN